MSCLCFIVLVQDSDAPTAILTNYWILGCPSNQFDFHCPSGKVIRNHDALLPIHQAITNSTSNEAYKNDWAYTDWPSTTS